MNFCEWYWVQFCCCFNLFSTNKNCFILIFLFIEQHRVFCIHSITQSCHLQQSRSSQCFITTHRLYVVNPSTVIYLVLIYQNMNIITGQLHFWCCFSNFLSNFLTNDMSSWQLLSRQRLLARNLQHIHYILIKIN